MSFQTIVDLIYQKAPLQKKRLTRYFAQQDDSYFRDADAIASKYTNYLEAEGIEIEKAVDAYVKLCMDFLRLQIAYMKSGKYPTAEASKAYEDVYSKPEAMKAYMIGLGLSQFLWHTHYVMFSAFRRYLAEQPKIQNYLEIGPGHGLFLDTALDFIDDTASVVALDISETSIEMTKGVIRCMRPEKIGEITFRVQDVFDYAPDRQFDFITMGEVLEHVNEPGRLLEKICSLLRPGGEAFVSTNMHSPAIDHVTQFESIDHIREVMQGAGLRIVEEEVLPVEDCSEAEAVEQRITINYCARLRRDP
jgi:SAM-dependent methyltransferase